MSFWSQKNTLKHVHAAVVVIIYAMHIRTTAGVGGRTAVFSSACGRMCNVCTQVPRDIGVRSSELEKLLVASVPGLGSAPCSLAVGFVIVTAAPAGQVVREICRHRTPQYVLASGRHLVAHTHLQPEDGDD